MLDRSLLAAQYSYRVPFLVLALALLIVLVFVLLIPLSLVQRYRVGTARRLARGWVGSINVALMTMSVGFFLVAAAISNTWVPDAFRYAILGLAAGCLLGVLGLMVTRWEATPRSLHYTPNRWLVLAITLAVTSRLLYGFWRGWHAWSAVSGDPSWLAASGAAGSLAAGAVVLGYYFAYAVGLRRRLRRHTRTMSSMSAGQR